LRLDRQVLDALLNEVMALPPLALGLSCFFGLMAVFFGWRLLRIYVVTMGAVAGALLGMQLPLDGFARIGVCLALALALGVLSWYFYRAMVFLFAGLMGAMLALLVSTNLTGGSVWPVYLAVGIAFAAAGILATVLLRPISTAFMALNGAFVTVGSCLVLAGTFLPRIRGSLTAFDPKLALATAVAALALACIGCLYQFAPADQKPQES